MFSSERSAARRHATDQRDGNHLVELALDLIEVNDLDGAGLGGIAPDVALRSRVLRWFCTVELDERPTASPISRTVGGTHEFFDGI